jgi:hypothetical protein
LVAIVRVSRRLPLCKAISVVLRSEEAAGADVDPPVRSPGLAGLDLARVRPRFSALSREQAGSSVVYLDGPGGSQVPDVVARAVADYLITTNANAAGVRHVEGDRRVARPCPPGGGGLPRLYGR